VVMWKRNTSHFRILGKSLDKRKVIYSNSKKVKVKQSYYRREQAQMVDRNIDLPFRNFGTRRWSVVRFTPRPIYPRKRPGTHCTGGWVGPRAGLDVCEKSAAPPTGIISPDRPTSSQTLYRLSYAGPPC
jgi:hypothetical protein